MAAARGPVEVELPAQPYASAPRAPRLDGERFVALRVSSPYLGDKCQALGGTLRFDIRAVSNVLVPSKFDRSSGLVILRASLPGERS